MSRRKQAVRSSCALLAVLLASCNAFDRGQLMPPVGGAGGSGGMGGSDVDGGDIDAGPCIPAAEQCNGVDDDCDDVADNLDPEADAYCEGIILNAEARCVSDSSGDTRCVRVGDCDPGFSNCDGIPSNGCEFRGMSCSCLTCEDAGEEDSGF